MILLHLADAFAQINWTEREYRKGEILPNTEETKGDRLGGRKAKIKNKITKRPNRTIAKQNRETKETKRGISTANQYKQI